MIQISWLQINKTHYRRIESIGFIFLHIVVLEVGFHGFDLLVSPELSVRLLDYYLFGFKVGLLGGDASPACL